ncbi:SH2 domain-containing adapter protein D-like [Myxocyprinus asiaticus]|uniref:SH2 domain-containing adapter protein D-like n=1 Tax=Myxocyprinus asiaticus TaxID=70543 RepID=UPI002221FB54|nr:SH2 domain-containing adapter protein D-like [Myxocyprinus asiaticus]XP_051549360.1 SH2 domain-containing adapter protein D-like [Myxocyprinus asiaticus]XP_051549361.1 SH2 domain-containing adapter protein D-like [Myxocyprinus asiaticus]XP_051549363.1 SH2 domain-containing adapter protein D-like [Myxocyprinus asiaticus]XP_051549364.1 SH2 domain-containing adapter protein D-like [Myxocyprinus asiaticus]
MAKWLKDYLSFGSKRVPPQPPKPDYTESEILKAYRAQKNLDFEDPYEDFDNRIKNDNGLSEAHHMGFGSPLKSSSLDIKVVSPKHRLIKVDSQDLGRSKILLSSVSLEEPTDPVIPSAPVMGDADYSDPFDACSETVQGPITPEYNGYMEPYEAQKVITELQRRAGGGGWGRGEVQLYDTPYEERVPGQPDLPEEGRESSLPQDDERPADEYDQPWEWKKEHISKAFAVQFEGAEWDRSSSPKELLRSCRPPPTTGSMKLRKPSDPHSMMGERVDPTQPLEKQVWYHGTLSRSEAESLLTLCKECSYLVRNSETSRSDYSLSLRSCQGFMHMKFSQSKDGRYILGQNSPPFETIPEVIHYYTTHKLPIKGAEHLSLLFPVLVQTL